MQEATIAVVLILFFALGIPWVMSLPFGQQMAVCGTVIVGALALPIIHSFFDKD